MTVPPDPHAAIAERLALLAQVRDFHTDQNPRWRELLDANPEMHRAEVRLEMTDGTTVELVIWRRGGLEGERIADPAAD